MCASWLLDDQLRRLPPPASNIVAFQSDYFLYPVRSDDGETIAKVFGAPLDDLSKAPEDTPLRRAIVKHLLSGRHMRSGASFILISAASGRPAPGWTALIEPKTEKGEAVV